MGRDFCINELEKVVEHILVTFPGDTKLQGAPQPKICLVLWGQYWGDRAGLFTAWENEGQWAKAEQEHFRLGIMKSSSCKFSGFLLPCKFSRIRWRKLWAPWSVGSFSNLNYPSVLWFLRILSHVCKEDLSCNREAQNVDVEGSLHGLRHPSPSAAEALCGRLQSQAPWQTSPSYAISPFTVLVIHHWALGVGRPVQRSLYPENLNAFSTMLLPAARHRQKPSERCSHSLELRNKVLCFFAP